MEKKKKTKKVNYTYAVGRRRSASARARLFKGDKENLVNDKPIGQYFAGQVLREAWRPVSVLLVLVSWASRIVRQITASRWERISKILRRGVMECLN